MKVFIVRVGRTTRGGNFQELHSQVVSVNDENLRSQVFDYFKSRYAGFDVTVDQVESVDISEQIPPPPVSRNHYSTEKKHGFFTNLKVKYTESEKQIFKEHEGLVRKANNLMSSLEDSIKDRFRALSYVDNGRMYEAELSTDYNGSVWKALPITSREFFNVVKNCVEDKPAEPIEVILPLDETGGKESIEELVIESGNPDDKFNDIPF